MAAGLRPISKLTFYIDFSFPSLSLPVHENVPALFLFARIFSQQKRQYNFRHTAIHRRWWESTPRAHEGPIAFRVRPLTTTWVMLQILNFRMRRAFWENFGENCRRERQKIVPSRSRKTRMKPSKTGKPLPKSQLDFESRLFDRLSTTPRCISRENCKLYIADFLLNLRNLMLEYC